MACSNCGKEKIAAKGLCQKCYYRLRRTGSLERTNAVNTGRCSYEGCENKAFAKNLCGHHYEKSRHPLAQLWRRLRSRGHGEFPDGWRRLDQFVADIGERPSERHQLRRVRQDEPWSKSNFRWLVPIPKVERQSSRQYHSDYGKLWSDMKKFGVSKERRAQMIADQNGGCAICGRPETVVNPRHPDREPRRLNIDHCHKSELLGVIKVRGLLCVRCNSMIGKRGANDSIEILEAAIAYLKNHAALDATPTK